VTLEYVDRHARSRPRAPAVVHEGREITYGDLARDVRRCARALRGLGVLRGEKVAVGCADLYRHWLLLLALEQLGAVSASLADREVESSNVLLSNCDRVLAEQVFSPGAVKWQHRLTAPWMDGALSAGNDASPDDFPALSGADPARISRTSGITGKSMLVVLDWRVRNGRIAQWAEYMKLDEGSRLLLSTPMSATLSYNQANACAQRGGTLMIPQRADMTRALLDGTVTHVFLLPRDLSQITERLPARPAKPSVLHVFSSGAAVSADLRDAILQRLAASFLDLYGTNEVSFVSTGTALDADGFGRVWPGVQVEIVDARDQPVPAGRPGLIRIRSECMGSGYLADPGASAEFFRQGWFYPGDQGELRADGALRLLGKKADVFNAGGVKIAADQVEDLARKLLGVSDVAACSVADAKGIGEIWIAVCGTVSDEATAKARDRLQKTYGARCHLVRTDAIPRDGAGKIARDALERSILAAKARQRSVKT
jgi:acyl-CoA synthetase (AMP-forming)/AMP-acid ligase II